MSSSNGDFVISNSIVKLVYDVTIGMIILIVMKVGMRGDMYIPCVFVYKCVLVKMR